MALRAGPIVDGETAGHADDHEEIHARLNALAVSAATAAELNAKIAEAAAADGPKFVKLRPGTHNISATVAVLAGVTLDATGSTIVCAAGMGTGVELDSNARLVGARIDASAGGARPLQFNDDTTGIVVERCEIFGSAATAAASATGAGVGISFRPGVKNLTVRDTWIHDVEIGVNCIYDVQNMTLERVRISNWSGRGIRMFGTTTYAVKNVMVRDCTLEPPVGPNPIHPIIALSDGGPLHENISVIGCTVVGRGTPYETDGTADQISINDCVGVRIIANTSTLGGERGINASRRSTDIVITDNYVTDADGPGIGVGDYVSGEVSNFTVTGNLVKNCGQDRDGNKAVWSLAGIRCMFASHGTIAGNTCVDDQGTATQRHGISVGYGSSDITIGGNACHGNTEHAIYNVTGTTIGGNTNIRFTEPLTAYRTTDATARSNVNTISAVADDDVLVLPVDGEAVYIAEAMAVYSTTDTADLRIAFGTPTGATTTWTPDGIASNQTSAASATLRRSSDGTFGIVGGIAGGTDMVATPKALIRTATAGGTVTLRWTQNTAEVSNTILRAGSWLKLTRVA